MSFSSFSDPANLVLASTALEAVWNKVKTSIPESKHERERTRITYLVAGFAPLALDEEDLKQNVLLHYRQPELS